MNIRVTQDAATDPRARRGAASCHDGSVERSYERSVSRTLFVIVYRIDLGSIDEFVFLRVPHGAQERARYKY